MNDSDEISDDLPADTGSAARIDAAALRQLLAWHDRTWRATLDLQQGFADVDEYADSPLGLRTREALQAGAIPADDRAVRLRDAHQALTRIVALISDEADPAVPGRPWLIDRVLEAAYAGLGWANARTKQ